jgi:hypothetical protein
VCVAKFPAGEQVVRQQWIPKEMRLAPWLDFHAQAGPFKRKYALLINPFYPKDPHASFGRHVLTPSLALTSIVASTPADWDVMSSRRIRLPANVWLRPLATLRARLFPPVSEVHVQQQYLNRSPR